MSDINDAIVLNKMQGERTESALFKDLQNSKTIRAMEKIQTKPSVHGVGSMTFKDFKTLIEASVQ
ncbi:MAG: hypothetical protein R2877_03600 [Bdellovibrionota bacterium]